MLSDKYIKISNSGGNVLLKNIPVLNYNDFYNLTVELFENEFIHCLNYYAFSDNDDLKFICCVADDENNSILIYSHKIKTGYNINIQSLTTKINAFYIFEREIAENFGVHFIGHPWLKPVRYPNNRFNKNNVIENYPFYTIESNETHEVGVGPVHAGIIEPGHFRFLCNGENVLHLEIQLGYQHRGVESLFLHYKHPLQRILLAENIAGDTTIGHSTACAALLESLAGEEVSEQLKVERAIALEMERIAIHIGDTAALCTDVAYQFGQVVNEALRTIIINTMLYWCGNRFGKGLIRPFGSYCPINEDVKNAILKNIADVEKRYKTITEKIFSLPSVLARFEQTGKVTNNQAALIGAVGMAARSTGLKRDTRWSHPVINSKIYLHQPVLIDKGDVWSRAILRKLEVEQSFNIIRELLNHINYSNHIEKPDYNQKFKASSFAISLTEGWRGEICHTAITDEKGEIFHYKIKDPSFHNWFALALAVREQEISDFPLCNKSFNLSYCGNDL